MRKIEPLAFATMIETKRQREQGKHPQRNCTAGQGVKEISLTPNRY